MHMPSLLPLAQKGDLAREVPPPAILPAALESRPFCAAHAHSGPPPAPQKGDLARMYRLFNRLPKGLEPMADIFRKHVEEEGAPRRAAAGCWLLL